MEEIERWMLVRKGGNEREGNRKKSVKDMESEEKKEETQGKREKRMKVKWTVKERICKEKKNK